MGSIVQAVKAKQQLQLIAKPENFKQLAGQTDSLGPQGSTTASISKYLRNKIKRSDRMGMEIDQAEQLDVLLNQSSKGAKQTLGY